MRRPLVGLELLQDPKATSIESCGVCVLMMIELMVTEGVEAFYPLNVQCKAKP